MKITKILLTLFAASIYSSTVLALPALQLGGDGTSGWNYDSGTDTWIVTDSSFTLSAYANAAKADGGDGSYAWDVLTLPKYAYLVAAATPDVGNVDAFDITVSNATLYTSGYGAAPLQDTNSLAGHGIYDTYFEIYEFEFDGLLELIGNTEPGDTGTGMGYSESFSIDIISLLAGVDGVHFDLFTVNSGFLLGNGHWDMASTDNKVVNAFAPYSHDAEYDCCTTTVPEPGVIGLLAVGLLGMAVARRRARV